MRTEAEARVCSQEDCPGDGRYQPPGKAHVPGCQHNAVAWVWGDADPASCAPSESPRESDPGPVQGEEPGT